MPPMPPHDLPIFRCMIMFASWFTMGEVDHGLGTFQKWSVKKPTPTSSYALYFGNIAPTLSL